jgi:hypothetical protein
VIIVHYFPIYWGFETEAPDRTFVTRSTLDEILPPFRMGLSYPGIPQAMAARRLV